ncbi:Chromosome segregation ATPase, partial [Giardia duodenalis]
VAVPLWSDCKECAAVSLLGQADLERGYLTSKEGYSGLRLAFQDPVIVSLVS